MGAIDLQELLDRLGYVDGEYVSLNERVPGGRFTSRIVSLADVPDTFPADRDLWFGVNPVRPLPDATAGRLPRGSVDDVTRLAALWADLDVKPSGVASYDVATAITEALSASLGAFPVAVTRSGHGMQPFWAIEDEPITDANREDLIVLLKRWKRLVRHVAAAHGGKVDSVYDLTRVLRIPETWNHKAAPVLVETAGANGRPLTLFEVDEALTAYGAVEVPSDRHVAAADFDGFTGEITWGVSTCGYAARTVAGWAADDPSERHTWLIASAVRLAAMAAYGCLTQQDHRAAITALSGRFLTLLDREPRRAPDPGELRNAIEWGISHVTGMSRSRLAEELGGHEHTAPIEIGATLAGVRGSPTTVSNPTPSPVGRDWALGSGSDGALGVIAPVVPLYPIVERTSWWPVDLTPAVLGIDMPSPPAFLRRSDGPAMFYPGKINGLLGPAESGKTWVALAAVCQAIWGGHRVSILDFEDSPTGLVQRLRGLGMDSEALLSRIAYINPEEALSPAGEIDLTTHLETWQPDLIVVDGVNAALSLLGYKIDSNDDTTAFFQRVLGPLASTGAAVVYVDHIAKHAPEDAMGGIGAQAKRAMTTGCALRVTVVRPFGRGVPDGLLRLTVDKDRGGHVRGVAHQAKHAGDVLIASDGENVTIEFNAPMARNEGTLGFDDDSRMEQQVIDFIQQQKTMPSANDIVRGLGLRKAAVLNALHRLKSANMVATQPGPRNAELHYLPSGSVLGQLAPAEEDAEEAAVSTHAQ